MAIIETKAVLPIKEVRSRKIQACSICMLGNRNICYFEMKYLPSKARWVDMLYLHFMVFVINSWAVQIVVFAVPVLSIISE